MKRSILLNPLTEGFSDFLETLRFFSFLEELMAIEGIEREIECQSFGRNGKMVVFVKKEKAFFSSGKPKLYPVLYCKLKRLEDGSCIDEVIRMMHRYIFVVEKNDRDFIFSLLDRIAQERRTFTIIFSVPPHEDRIIFEIKEGG